MAYKSIVTRYFESLDTTKKDTRTLIYNEANPTSFDYDGKSDYIIHNNPGESTRDPEESNGSNNGNILAPIDEKFYALATVCVYVLFKLAGLNFNTSTPSAPARVVSIIRNGAIPLPANLPLLVFPYKIDWYRWDNIIVPVLYTEDFSPQKMVNISDFRNNPIVLVKRLESALKLKFAEHKMLP